MIGNLNVWLWVVLVIVIFVIFKYFMKFCKRKFMCNWSDVEIEEYIIVFYQFLLVYFVISIFL